MANELLDDALSTLRAHGFRPRIIQGKHYKIRWDDNGRQQTFIVSRSPSDAYRAIHKSRAALRRRLNDRPAAS
jgi:hypothetical protein